MAKQTLTHVLPDGGIAKRTTANAYTHVLIGRRDLNRDRADAAKICKTDLSNFAWYQKQIEAGVGNSYGEYRWEQCLTQAAFDEAVRRVGDATTAQEYAQRLAARRVAELGEGDFGGWVVLQWSGSLANASKGINRWRDRCGWSDVQAVAIVPAP